MSEARSILVGDVVQMVIAQPGGAVSALVVTALNGDSTADAFDLGHLFLAVRIPLHKLWLASPSELDASVTYLDGKRTVREQAERFLRGEWVTSPRLP